MTQFPDMVAGLRSWGANVIADDVFWIDEPFFQAGPDEVAVDAAAAAGIPYFSAAGNSSVIAGGNEVGSWEAPAFRPTSCPTGMSEYGECMDFDPGPGISNTEEITLGPHGQFFLDRQWSEPFGGVQTDLDVKLLDAAGQVLASSNYPNTGDNGIQEPVEVFSYVNDASTPATVYLAIGKARSAHPGNPRLKYVLLQASRILDVQFPTSSGGDIVGPTIFAHNGASGAMSIAAVPFNDSTRVE